ncbi:GlxA family transcriptional regulator [Rubellimicrobium sp. CFH 75288]|uniref:GlxA family transcriptional regulator n=1 Tax=Rubellimicrobium sp. CFH 75288 TaxID=2697034 RepID=UPI0014133CD7|nr:GlxA family transcriptional regulator [Rubellimicrobium sp. CFH 75288]NAZ37806.1 helix-turn-helix domain-containing protein [Rubellimicrobium sp. CFH 75288]
MRRAPGEPHRVSLVLVPGFSFLALPLVTEPLFVANWVSGRSLFAWRRLSVDGLAVPSSSGAVLPVDSPLGPADEAETVLVLASFEARAAAADARLLGWLRRMARQGASVGGIETGTEVLAAAGLLDGETAAVHWYTIEGFRERYPAVRAVPGLFHAAPRRPTSAGGTATLDLVLGLVAQEGGSALAQEVAHHLLADGPRAGTTRQAAAEIPPGSPDAVARALAILEAERGEPPGPAALARQVGLSPRHLQRLFRLRLGRSVGETARALRLERAHGLVQQTDLPLSEVAAACGFGSLAALSRAYRRAFGVCPSRDRSPSVSGSVLRPLRGPEAQ